jgi:hypothetical protein
MGEVGAGALVFQNRELFFLRRVGCWGWVFVHLLAPLFSVSTSTSRSSLDPAKAFMSVDSEGGGDHAKDNDG